MSAHIRFSDNDYEPTDSEEENYTPRERKLLKRARTKDESESEDEKEVLGLGSSSDSDDQSDLALSDIEGQDDDDGIPNVHAWGKNRKQFYSTDYVDPDYGTYEGKDAEQADLEEEEAKLLQKELLEQLAPDDFVLSGVTQARTADKKQEELTKLSKEQQKDILFKEADILIDELKDRMKVVETYLAPIITLSEDGKIADSEALTFVKVYYEIILKYHVNLNVYILLLNTKDKVTNHPILKRLYEWRQLYMKFDPIFNETIKPQIEYLLEQNKTKKKKLLDVLSKILEPVQANEGNSEKNKTVTFDLNDAEDEEMDDNVEEQDELDLGDARRGITYQIAKNKGLTPRRNKEQRNPRVKYKNKFRKAKIRRLGAVRQVRTETTRYAGELSGIKATVCKSVKIKS